MIDADDASLEGAIRAYAAVALMVAGSTLAGSLIAPRWGTSPVDLIYLPPVLGAASLFGLRPALFAAAASALAYNFFFTVPVHSFRIDRPADMVTVAMLFLVAFVTSQLASRMRSQARAASAESARNASIAGLARRLISCSSVADIGKVGCTELAALFGCNAVLLLPGKEQPQLVAAMPEGAPLTPSDFAAAAFVLHSGEVAGRGTRRLDPAEWQFHPVKSDAKVLATMGLARDDGRPPATGEALPLLVNLLDQVALALERAQLEAEMQGVAQLRERDRLRGALLSSVGHDLRTPLTAIRAAAAQLASSKDGDRDLAGTIDVEAGKLERYITNLLGMARIEAGAVRLRSEPIDLVDAVSAAVRDLKAGLAGHSVEIALPADLPLVRTDPQLLHHVLINLIDNAARYSPAGSVIVVAGEFSDKGVGLAVRDEGPGIDRPQAELFETFTRIAGSDRKGGAGLGLAIVKGLADAMGVEVSGRNLPSGGGAEFSLLFPPQLIVGMQDGAVGQGA